MAAMPTPSDDHWTDGPHLGEPTAGEPHPDEANLDAGHPEAAAVDHRFPCARCGATLAFSPGQQALTCTWCGHVNEIAASDAAIEELDPHAVLAGARTSAETVEASVVRCEGCGAETTPPEHATAFDCGYCGFHIVASSRQCTVIRPRSLLPFAIPRDDARAAFRKWLKRLWLAPSAPKRQIHSLEKLVGMYVPHWTYDSRTVTHYTGQRGDAYYVTETYTVTVNGKTQTRTRQKRKIRWSYAAGTVHNGFDDLLVVGSRSLPEKHLAALEPWDLEALVPFTESYLAGFRAERYQVDLEEGFERARLMMEPAIDASIRHDIGGDEQRISTKDTSYHDVTFKHLLLPVWISAYRYRDTVYRFLVNARTGEVRGERPWSAWKIAGAITAGLLAIGVAVFLAMR